MGFLHLSCWFPSCDKLQISGLGQEMYLQHGPRPMNIVSNAVVSQLPIALSPAKKRARRKMLWGLGGRVHDLDRGTYGACS